MSRIRNTAHTEIRIRMKWRKSHLVLSLLLNGLRVQQILRERHCSSEIRRDRAVLIFCPCQSTSFHFSQPISPLRIEREREKWGCAVFWLIQCLLSSRGQASGREEDYASAMVTSTWKRNTIMLYNVKDPKLEPRNRIFLPSGKRTRTHYGSRTRFESGWSIKCNNVKIKLYGQISGK